MNWIKDLFSNWMAEKSKEGGPTQGMRPLRGDGTWPWTAYADGADIVVINARATCFGGSDDPQDSGETASGISTKGNPNLSACSLPMRYDGKKPALIKALGGSPIPKLPYKTTLVEVKSNGKTIIVPVIDCGPAKYTGNAIDLTIAAARKFRSLASAKNFEMTCDFRIFGAVKYLKPEDYL